MLKPGNQSGNTTAAAKAPTATARSMINKFCSAIAGGRLSSSSGVAILLDMIISKDIDAFVRYTRRGHLQGLTNRHSPGVRLASTNLVRCPGSQLLLQRLPLEARLMRRRWR